MLPNSFLVGLRPSTVLLVECLLDLGDLEASSEPAESAKHAYFLAELLSDFAQGETKRYERRLRVHLKLVHS